MSKPKEELTFGELSQVQRLKRVAPEEGLLLVALRVGFGEAAPEKMLSGC